MLARRKWLILLITFACALTGWLIAMLQTPMYQARTALEVQGPNDNFLNLKDLDPSVSEGQSSMEGYVETQAKILQDEALLEKTLTKLNLDHKPESIRRATHNLTVRASNQSHVVELLYDATNPDVAAITAAKRSKARALLKV